MKSYIRTKEHRKKISIALMGRKFSEERKQKLRGPRPVEQSENNYNWKGDLVSYDGLHKWVVRHLGKPMICEKCGNDKKKKYEWANVDHKYRRVLDDYLRLCTSCHRNHDYNNHLSDKNSRWGPVKNKLVGDD